MNKHIEACPFFVSMTNTTNPIYQCPKPAFLSTRDVTPFSIDLRNFQQDAIIAPETS